MMFDATRSRSINTCYRKKILGFSLKTVPEIRKRFLTSELLVSVHFRIQVKVFLHTSRKKTRKTEYDLNQLQIGYLLF